QHRRVVPVHARLDDLRVPLVARQVEALEEELDDEPCGDHRRVEAPEQERGHPPAVVLAVDVEDREHDQVGEDEREDAAEADPAVPEDRRERHVPDRADEAQDRDRRPDDRPPELRDGRMGVEEQRAPEVLRHPGRARASSTSRRRRKSRKTSASRTIMSGPPTNSPSVNCQPRTSAIRIPSSATRFVEANSKAVEAVKSAPRRKSERASATAAYEHDDDAAPRPVATASERGESSGSRRRIAPFDTTACTTPESANPRISAQRIS